MNCRRSTWPQSTWTNRDCPSEKAFRSEIKKQISRKFGLRVPLDLYQQFQLIYQQFQRGYEFPLLPPILAFHDSPRNLQRRVWSGRGALPEDTSKTRPQIASLRNFQQVIMKSSQILPLDGPIFLTTCWILENLSFNPFDKVVSLKAPKQAGSFFLPGPASTKKGYGIYSPVLVLIQLAWFVWGTDLHTDYG